MGTQGAGRKRLPNRERLTAEDEALNQIAREVRAGPVMPGGGARSCQAAVSPSVRGPQPGSRRAGRLSSGRPGDRPATLTPPLPPAPLGRCPLGAWSWGAAPGARWPRRWVGDRRPALLYCTLGVL